MVIHSRWILGFSRQAQEEVMNQELKYNGDFPGGPVVKTSPSNTCLYLFLVEEPHALPPKKKKKKRKEKAKNKQTNKKTWDRNNIVTNWIKNFKNGLHQKILKELKYAISVKTTLSAMIIFIIARRLAHSLHISNGWHDKLGISIAGEKRRNTSFFFSALFIYLLYNIVLVLPYIDMNPPWVFELCAWVLSHSVVSDSFRPHEP